MQSGPRSCSSNPPLFSDHPALEGQSWAGLMMQGLSPGPNPMAGNNANPASPSLLWTYRQVRVRQTTDEDTVPGQADASDSGCPPLAFCLHGTKT